MLWHWELDSMASSRGESKGVFSTFIEMKSRLYTAFAGKDRTARKPIWQVFKYEVPHLA